MNTFAAIWRLTTPSEVAEIINSQRAQIGGDSHNLEEQAISLAEKDIYEKLIKGYIEKQ